MTGTSEADAAPQTKTVVQPVQAAPAADPAPWPASRWALPVAGLAVLLALLAPYWGGLLGALGVPGPTDDLEARLDGFGVELTELSARPAGDPEGVGDLAARLTALEARRFADPERQDDLAVRLRAAEAALPPSEAESQRLAEALASIELLGRRIDTLPAPIDSDRVRAIMIDVLAASNRTSVETATVLAALEERVAQLAATLAAYDLAIATLNARVSEDLPQSLAALNADSLDIAADLAALREELRPPEGAEVLRPMLEEAGNLQMQLSRGIPFADTMTRMARLSGNPAPFMGLFDPIAAYAGSGIATAEALAERYDGVVRSFSRPDLGGDQKGLLGEALTGLSSMVTVRSTPDETVADGPGPALAAARPLLAAGDLAGALAVLAPIDRGTAEFAAWREAATARLAADRLAIEIVAAIFMHFDREG